MEFNPQNTEKLADNSDSSGQLLARSYKCSFCKKGFSNAQALGGHMNIHRRDRAKLKQLSEEEEDDDEKFLSLDISVKNPIHKPSNSQEKVLFHLDSVEDENYTNSLHNKVININTNINVSTA